MLSLTCSNGVPRPTPYASFHMYNGFLTSEYFMHVSSFTDDLALLYISQYDLFQAQAALTDVSFLNGLHTYTVIGENLFR